MSAVIIDAVRTPIGRHGGVLKSVRPDDLAAVTIAAVLARSGVAGDQIEDVYWGAANQAGEDNRNVARMSALLAGLPESVGGVTVNRLCGSGLQAVNSAAHAIAAGAGECFIAGGVESMTRAPFVMAKPEAAFARGQPAVFDTTLGWRFVNPQLAEKYYPYTMGETAENVAERYELSREQQDQFALRSQQRAAAAMAAGRFQAEIVAVPIKGRKGEVTLVDTDEHPRPEVTLEQLQALKPVFRQNGTVTAGNSAGLNDGAAAVLVMSEEAAQRMGLRPLARIVSTAVAGVDPAFMGLGPIAASQKALERAGLTVADLDLVELNEAFAAQAVACMEQLGLPDDKVNVNGGAIALGHPLGMSGARIVGTLVHELRRRGGRYGLATMCIGVGQGIATVVECLPAD